MRAGPGGQRSAVDQPATGARRPRRDAPAAARSHLPALRRRRRCDPLLPGRARVPAHRADRRRRRPSTHHLPRAHAHTTRHRVPHRSRRRLPPPRLLGRRMERPPRRPPTRAPTTACRSTPGRPATAPPAVVGCTSSTRPATATRSTPAGYHFDPDDEPTRWTEAEMGRAIFSYRGQVDQRFMTVHS